MKTEQAVSCDKVSLDGKIVIVDGPDACGKTTLIKELTSKAIDYGYVPITFHNGKYNSWQEALNIMNAQINMAGEHEHMCQLNGYRSIAIFDRFALSTVVYGTLIDGDTPSESQVSDTIGRLVGLDSAGICKTLFINVSRDVESAIKDWESRLDMEHVKDETQMRNIHKMFQYMRHILPNNLTINYHVEDDERMFSVINQILNTGEPS